MSSTVPAMKGRMGDTVYYLLSLKASELVNLVKEPKNMPGWDDEKIEEIYQRKINYPRVRNQIAPYLANNTDSRFFGSLIVAAFNFDDTVEFTPLHDIAAVNASKLRPDEKEAGSKIGMLTLHGGIMMAPLDGQHRLKALEFAMLGKDQRGNDIPGINVDPELAKEDISVILVPYIPDKARRIFTRVNRYARRPSSAETYVTDDDDLFAVLARRVANNIGGRLVKYTNATLTVKDGEFTTLTILHACCRHIVDYSFPEPIKEQAKRPDFSAEIEKACEHAVLNVWGRLLSKIEVFADATADRSEQGDAGRTEIRRSNLLGKPVPQECLVLAYLALTEGGTKMPWQEACQRLNAVPWAITPENIGGVWQGVLWSGGTRKGRILTKNRQISSRLIAYMAGEILTQDAENQLLTDYKELFPETERDDKSLPPRVTVGD